MNVKVLKKEKDMLLVELGGESVGFANLIRKELWNDKNVDEAAYIKEHPYMAEPKVYVKMKGKFSPKSALLNAAKRIESNIKELKKEFQRNLK